MLTIPEPPDESDYATEYELLSFSQRQFNLASRVPLPPVEITLPWPHGHRNTITTRGTLIGMMTYPLVDERRVVHKIGVLFMTRHGHTDPSNWSAFFIENGETMMAVHTSNHGKMDVCVLSYTGKKRALWRFLHRHIANVVGTTLHHIWES